jgi:hypothetical protein
MSSSRNNALLFFNNSGKLLENYESIGQSIYLREL